MKRLFFILALFACLTPAKAQVTDGTKQCLFKTYDKYHVPYRIPAIATTKKGNLLALCDRRYCGFDIGFGKIDIVARTSKRTTGAHGVPTPLWSEAAASRERTTAATETWLWWLTERATASCA